MNTEHRAGPMVIDSAQAQCLLTADVAIDALAEALRTGLDPATTPPRASVPLTGGEFLLMPAEFGRYAGVKVLTVNTAPAAAGYPRIQGSYLLFDSRTMAPLAVLDGTVLTAVRTPAVSALAVRCLAVERPVRLLVFGTGPQAMAHVEAIGAVRTLDEVIVVGQTTEAAEGLVETLRGRGHRARPGQAGDVADADVIACCTTARQPLFDGSLVPDHAVVVAMGSHEPDARETDDVLAKRATIYVEDVDNALREAGDVVLAVNNGSISVAELRTITELVNGPVPQRRGPALVKTVGMAWQDLVVAVAAYEGASAEGDVEEFA